MKGGIWVVGELKHGGLPEVTLELLSKARELKEKGDFLVTAVLIGERAGEARALPFRFGAERVVLVEDESLEPFSETQYGAILAHLAHEWMPEIILAGATKRAMAYMPVCQTILETGLTANCMDLDIEEGSGVLLQTRPAYGGNLMATIVCRKKRPQMATIRPGVFKAVPLESPIQGEVVEFGLTEEFKQNPFELLEVIREEGDADAPDYKGAKVVVTAGRGVGDPETISRLKELTRLLGGVLGATRPVTDMGLLPKHAQIGQTGHIISPRLYLGFGVSGAAPHTIGIQGADIIVAVNKDENAPIFKMATFGVKADAKAIIPVLIEILKGQKGGEGV